MEPHRDQLPISDPKNPIVGRPHFLPPNLLLLSLKFMLLNPNLPPSKSKESELIFSQRIFIFFRREPREFEIRNVCFLCDVELEPLSCPCDELPMSCHDAGLPSSGSPLKDKREEC
ncbi:hypothetical protein COLO4_09237 [Corchorus olitorius]|uniref:Uncharacterized protein n=1 Tax=Corchorus olitorius TaxID=93759 RepID=A0A1R3KCQ6_9ROSI|nr:hypothetical protein COLO4_09237 [Corchorus olitorius]